MGLGTALALGAGAMSIMNTRSNMNAQIAAARTNSMLIQREAEINANFASMTAGMQANAIRSRASYESRLTELDAQISRRNAIVAEQDAQSVFENTRFQVDQVERRNRRLAGAQRAAYGKAGVTIEGSAQDVMFDSALAGEMEELATIYIGDQEIRKHLMDAYNSNLSADMKDYNARSVLHFGKQEAGYRQWQAGASAAVQLSEGNMRSARLLSSIPTIRSQGYANMFGTALQSAATGYSMMRSTGE